MADTLEIFGDEFTNVTGIKATDDNDQIKVYIRPQGTKSISANGTGIDVAEYASVDVNVSAPSPSLQSKTYNVSSAGTATVTADSGYDGLSSVAVSVPSADPYVGFINNRFYTENNQRKWSVTAFAEVDEGEGDVAGWLPQNFRETRDYAVQAVSANTTVTPTESTQTVGGANYMMESAVTVNAIPSNYVGSGITQRSSSDLTASGATVTVPSGYYSAQASKAVASGTAGTPTATKGSVSNHSVSVTPSVTNTGGYISGGAINGTAVTVTASELASGNKAITENGTDIDVVGYSTVSVNVSGGTSVQTKTGTFTGSNGVSVDISCDFAPDLIYVYGDLSGSTSNRGVISITIVKDTMILQTSDTSSSSANESAPYYVSNGVSGYVGNSSYCHATYSNSTLTIATGSNTSSNRFTSGITYSYKLLKWTT